jgi:hypothetical protein
VGQRGKTRGKILTKFIPSKRMNIGLKQANQREKTRERRPEREDQREKKERKGKTCSR